MRHILTSPGLAMCHGLISNSSARASARTACHNHFMARVPDHHQLSLTVTFSAPCLVIENCHASTPKFNKQIGACRGEDQCAECGTLIITHHIDPFDQIHHTGSKPVRNPLYTAAVPKAHREPIEIPVQQTVIFVIKSHT